jgi:hypothetical protein
MNNEFINQQQDNSNVPNTSLPQVKTYVSDDNLTYNKLLKEHEQKNTIRTAIDGNTHYKGNNYLEHDFETYAQTTGSGIDLNIANYSIDELYELIDIDKDNATINMILENVLSIKQDFREHKLPQLVNFFDNIGRVLVYDMENVVLPTREQLSNTDNGENLILPETDQRSNTIDGDGVDIPDEKTTINETDELKKNDITYDDRGDTMISFNSQNIHNINPLLRENVSRIISVDSFFRNNSIPSIKNISYSSIPNDYQSIYSTTNFTITLSEPVTFVTKLILDSVYIPNTFYQIDDAYGNTSFAFRFINTPAPNPYKLIKIENGNHNITNLIDDIVTQINTKFSKSLSSLDILYNTTNGKVQFLLDEPYEIIFYDDTYYQFFLNEGIAIPQILPKMNYNLGWVLGFRDPAYKIDVLTTSGKFLLKGEAMADLRGPRYFIIVIDDFNHNHLNKSVISSENRREKPALPTYDTENLQIEVRDGIATYQQVVDGENIDNYPINGQYPFYTRQATTNLTQPQLYALNEISRERQKSSKLIIDSPTENNVFGIIPNTLGHNTDFGDAIVLTANQVSDNTRDYFGKVDIDRMAVRLYDDKGHLMNLNGTNWTFTLRALCSYNVNNDDDYIKYTHNLHY